MPVEQAYKPSRRFITFLIVGFMTAIVGGAGVMYYLGSFTEAKVFHNIAPAYRLAYLYHTGNYDNFKPMLNQVADHLQKAGIKAETPFAMLMNDNGTPEEKRVAKVGYLVAEGVAVPAPLEVETFASREVISATFDGGAKMGSFKAYNSILEFSQSAGYKLSMPALEIYHDDAPEYQLGASKLGK